MKESLETFEIATRFRPKEKSSQRDEKYPGLEKHVRFHKLPNWAKISENKSGFTNEKCN